jgi:hypothetical protein
VCDSDIYTSYETYSSYLKPEALSTVHSRTNLGPRSDTAHSLQSSTLHIIWCLYMLHIINTTYIIVCFYAYLCYTLTRSFLILSPTAEGLLYSVDKWQLQSTVTKRKVWKNMSIHSDNSNARCYTQLRVRSGYHALHGNVSS